MLDRDGTIVIDKHYLADPAGLELAPGAEAGLRHMQQLGCRMVVITNQSGVARGLMTMQQVSAVNDALRDMLERAGVSIDGFYICPHAPSDGCSCRKPQAALLLQAAGEFGFDPARSVVIGDKASDVGMGRNVGAVTMLIAPAGEVNDAEADFVIQGLDQAAAIIAQQLMDAGPSGPIVG